MIQNMGKKEKYKKKSHKLLINEVLIFYCFFSCELVFIANTCMYIISLFIQYF